MSTIALLHPDHITIIDNRFPRNDIVNFKELPKVIQEELTSVDVFRSYGFQELNGYKDRTCMLSCGGYWTYPTTNTGMKIERESHKEQFVITSYGSHNYQWDGQTLTNTIKEYV